MKISFLITSVFVVSVIFVSCSKNNSSKQSNYVAQVEKFRKEKNDFMKDSLDSPFNQDSNAIFHPLNYYDPDPDFVFKSRLTEYDKKDTVQILGTKGEERQVIRFGYVDINFKNKVYKINVYKSWTKNDQEYYSIWFTDETTGEETYGVGRYIDFDLNRDPHYLYTIDFNLAYNPYCAYSALYSCAIPTKEDHIAFPVEAGEKKFHN